MLVPAGRIIKSAYRRRKIVVAFNTINAETTLAIARAAAHLKTPALFEVSEKSIAYLGMSTIVALVKAAANEVGSVPLGIHLDHGKSFEICAAAIGAGFSSVMIDGSSLPLAENIKLTKRVVNLAHRRGVVVQGEVGALVSRSPRGGYVQASREFMTDPQQAAEFVRLTGVDSLGVAVGTLHGPIKMFRRLPHIDFKRLEEIHRRVRIPLVLHGGSGVPVADLRKAAKLGVAVVNIDTELRLVYLASLQRSLKKHSSEHDPRIVFAPVVEALTRAAVKKLKGVRTI